MNEFKKGQGVYRFISRECIEKLTIISEKSKSLYTYEVMDELGICFRVCEDELYTIENIRLEQVKRKI